MAAKPNCLIVVFMVAAVFFGFSAAKLSEKEMFGSKSLRCLVCKALVDEIEYKIGLVDPKKRVEKVASFRMGGSGQRQAEKTLVRQLG